VPDTQSDFRLDHEEVSLRGFGAATKRAIRAARYAWDESMARRNSPYELFKWKALESSALSPEYFMHILPSHKLIYIEVPKSASSYILEKLQELTKSNASGAKNIHRRSESGFDSPLSMGIVPFVRLIDDPETLIFTSVRNPYSRLVSCYFDKFSNVTLGDGSYISNVYISYQRIAMRSVSEGGSISFEDFVDFACATAPFRFDGHWCRQSDIIPDAIAIPKAIVRFETMQDDFIAVLRRLPTRPLPPSPPIAQRPATNEKRLKEVLSAGTAARILDTYATDFSRFGYSATIPGA